MGKCSGYPPDIYKNGHPKMCIEKQLWIGGEGISSMSFIGVIPGHQHVFACHYGEKERGRTMYFSMSLREMIGKSLTLGII